MTGLLVLRVGGDLVHADVGAVPPDRSGPRRRSAPRGGRRGGRPSASAGRRRSVRRVSATSGLSRYQRYRILLGCMTSDSVAVPPSSAATASRSPGPTAAYAHASNQDMLTAAIDGLVARFGLQDERLGEVAAGAVLKHSRDFNLTRESVLGSRLAPTTPAYDVQQACGTGLETAILVANKIALGQIDVGDRRRRRHHLGRPDRGQRGPARGAARAQPGQALGRPAQGAGAAAARASSCRPIPQNSEPRTGLSMGEHQAITTREWGITREAQDELAAAVAPQPRRGLRPRLLRRPAHAVPRPDPRPEPARRTPPSRSSRSSSRSSARRGDGATMTAGNSTPLTDGASTVLLASRRVGRRAQPAGAGAPGRRRDRRGRLRARRPQADGLLMAPVYALPRLLARNKLTLQDFDFYEIHEAFAVDRAHHARGLGGRRVLQAVPRPGRALGAIDRVEAQRQRLVARRRPPVRRDRRPHRRHAGQAAARERRRAAA